MVRTAATKPSSRKATKSVQAELDAWLRGEPDLGTDGLTLLRAYAEAETAAHKATKAAAPSTASEPSVADPSLAEDGSPDESGQSTGDSDSEILAAPAVSRGVPATLRLHQVPEIEAEALSQAHGRLIATGCLQAELLGRHDGLAYRVTPEGRRRLGAA